MHTLVEDTCCLTTADVKCRMTNIEAIRVKYVINNRFPIGKTCAHVYIINFHDRAGLIPFLNSPLTSYLKFYYSQTFGHCYPQRKASQYLKIREQ